MTVLATFVSQTLIGNFLENGTFWPIPQEMLVFYIVFSILLGLLCFGLKAALIDKSDKKKNHVIQSVVCGSLLYVILECFMPSSVIAPGPIGAGASPESSSFASDLAKNMGQTVFVIFLTGPVKVWLDIKRGDTSISELQADLQDERSWLHKKLGVDERPGLFPEDNRPRRRQRENATSAEDAQY